MARYYRLGPVHATLIPFELRLSEGLFTPKTRVFFCCGYIKTPIHLNGARSRSRMPAAEKTHVWIDPQGLFTPKTRVFSAAEILVRIYQNPMHLNGARWRTTFFRRRISRCLHNLVRQRVPSKCMGFWYIRSRISAAEKTRVVWIGP